MSQVEIKTCNVIYNDENDQLDGYNEVHVITNFQTFDHIFANIESIIKNNLIHGCECTTLEEVTIASDDHNFLQYLEEYCKGNICGIKVVFEYIFK